MKLRHITRQLTRTNTYSPLHSLSQRPTLHNLQSHKFSSNLDNDKDNIMKTGPMKKMSEFEANLRFQAKTARNHSFWSLTALDQEHKEWIQRYNKELSKLNTSNCTQPLFTDTNKWIKYMLSNAFDGIQRVRMRGLKKNIMCYEEFMIGAIKSFKSLQNMNGRNVNKISKCFTPNLCNQFAEIKNALFNADEDGKEYVIENMEMFADSLKFYEQYDGSTDEGNLPDLEMYFNVRCYYLLRDVNAMDMNMKCMKRKYADIEWMGLFEPTFEDKEFKTFNLSDKGFFIHAIEVAEL